ncbi:uncharacterized protein N0V89_012216 [Didymosphaeria variabile]|uniref:Uncharacterized protein n=1 Tax=Didymosphaeria variabile TaxID=1932322 RepID=A0A9W9C4S6_9PLEO|nr:uncharacterized protein N0V89_012216 [Didymosphaeria variabile]KAJ4344474.1 hypothetical protein N0V89_012216 [Didymosphaeria variabile]
MVFTIPRTASHLLLKLLNLHEQPSIHRHSNNLDGYIFLPAAVPRFRYCLPGKPIREWTEEEKTTLIGVMQSSFDDWLGLIQEAEERGKSTFVKEHLHWMMNPVAEARLYENEQSDPSSAIQFQVNWKDSQPSEAREGHNVTCLPDAFLLQHIKPTFLIRHPALTFPSNLRTIIDNQSNSTAMTEEKIQQWECTYLWSLSMYKFYVQSTGEFDRRSLVEGVEYPIVLDAQDLGDEALVKKYAKAVGLHEDKVRFTWKATDKEVLSDMGTMEKRMKSTILGSSGIKKDRLRSEESDMETLREEWSREFGDMLSERLVKLVNGSMDAYEMLKSVRLRL